MKKSLIGALVFAGTLAFTACNKEVVVTENGNGIENVGDELQAGEGFIEIGVTNTGVGTRAGRPVGSSAAANNVNKIKIVAYKYNQNKWELDPAVKVSKVYNDNSVNGTEYPDGVSEVDWTKGPEGEGNSVIDRYGKQKLKLTGLTANQKYKVAVYGYNDSDVYGFTDVTTGNDITMNSQNVKNGFEIEEVFAGTSEEVTTDENGKFNKYITAILERQVAGMLAYFENVPVVVENERLAYVQVVASNKANKFSIPSFTEFNGFDMTNKEDILLTFNLAKIATNYHTAVDGSYTFADLSQNGYTGTEEGPMPFAEGYNAPKGLKLKQNSMFGGRFVLPYDGHKDTQTLTIRMIGESGSIVKTYNVKINNTASNINPLEKLDEYKYDIRRNNFYSIGKKMKTDGGVDPTDPTDPDKPIDLTKNTDITVIINDAWDALHDMGIED